MILLKLKISAHVQREKNVSSIMHRLLFYLFILKEENNIYCIYNKYTTLLIYFGIGYKLQQG